MRTAVLLLALVALLAIPLAAQAEAPLVPDDATLVYVTTSGGQQLTGFAIGFQLATKDQAGALGLPAWAQAVVSRLSVDALVLTGNSATSLAPGLSGNLIEVSRRLKVGGTVFLDNQPDRGRFGGYVGYSIVPAAEPPALVQTLRGARVVAMGLSVGVGPTEHGLAGTLSYAKRF